MLVVDHRPDIGFVDAHAKGDSSHDDPRRAVNKSLLVAAAHGRLQPGVVGYGIDPLLVQGCGQGLGVPLARDIHDTAAGDPPQQTDQGFGLCPW